MHSVAMEITVMVEFIHLMANSLSSADYRADDITDDAVPCDVTCVFKKKKCVFMFH